MGTFLTVGRRVPCGVWDRRGLEGRKKGDGGMGRSSCCCLEDWGRLGWMAAVGAGTRDFADESIPSQFYHISLGDGLLGHYGTSCCSIVLPGACCCSGFFLCDMRHAW